MSQSGIINTAGGGGSGSAIQTITGNSGGAVPPTANNINLLGTGGVTVTGTPGTSTLTIASSGGGGGFTPNSTIQLSDDFIGAQFPTGQSVLTSNYGWNATGGDIISADTLDNSHPGLILFQNGTFNPCYLFLDQASGNSGTGNSFILGGGQIIINWVFHISILSSITSRYVLQIGMGDTPSDDQANGVYFEYSDNENSGNWILKTASSSTRTSTNTSTSASIGWHNAQITVNASANSINFTLDGVSLGNITTHIPTISISPFIQTIPDSITTPTTANVVYSDLFYLNQTLTTAR